MLISLTHWNETCVKVEMQLQRIGDTICVEIKKIFTESQFYKIGVSKFTASKFTEFSSTLKDSLRPSGQGISAWIKPSSPKYNAAYVHC